MTSDQRQIRRKLPILEHAEQADNASKTRRYFMVGRVSSTADATPMRAWRKRA